MKCKRCKIVLTKDFYGCCLPGCLNRRPVENKKFDRIKIIERGLLKFPIIRYISTLSAEPDYKSYSDY